ncbi:hypothetical protein [uncultured Secundilactobacillus sp.]|uniref:hypothetical protein n=1 Tax=uncultured Secundilactobacillus sp. TaxID=2813935 RepID=UPI002590C644|nr:hypothetical protein [uncultured Secundilactobacillus sp.]
MSEPLSVTLPQEQTDELRQQIQALVNSALEHVKNHSDASPFLRGKTQASAYIGCSTDSVTRMVAAGMPYHVLPELPSMMLFSKAEIDAYILGA